MYSKVSKFQSFKVSKIQVFIVPKFPSFKVSRFPKSSRVSKFQSLSLPMFQRFHVSDLWIFKLSNFKKGGARKFKHADFWDYEGHKNKTVWKTAWDLSCIYRSNSAGNKGAKVKWLTEHPSMSEKNQKLARYDIRGSLNGGFGEWWVWYWGGAPAPPQTPPFTWGGCAPPRKWGGLGGRGCAPPEPIKSLTPRLLTPGLQALGICTVDRKWLSDNERHKISWCPGWVKCSTRAFDLHNPFLCKLLPPTL